MALNIVIIEDEPAIARHIKKILESHDSSFQILTILSDVKEGILWLQNNENTYDLIFSDIQLADGLSFEIFEAVKPTKPIIFITAYEEYTLQAFNTNGIHYVVKPFQKEDIIKAMEKYDVLTTNGRTSMENTFNEEKLKSLIDTLSSIDRTQFKKAYLVHYQNKLIPIKTEDIAWFYTENDVVYAQTNTNKLYTIESTLERIFVEISPVDFFRANRQFIINRTSIKDIDFYFNGRLIINVIPSAKEKVIVSKAKVPAFKKWMDNS